VLVDVVVRDRNGRPVLNLNADDFELAEDGVKHTIDSFSRVSRGSGIGVSVAWRTPNTTIAVASSGSPETPPDSGGAEPEEGTTAIVFDQLSAESLRLAQKATLDYVPMNGESGVRVGVFATDPGIRVLQRFTTDRSLIRKAVAGVLPSGTSAGEQKAERTDQLMDRRRDLYGPGDPTAGGATASTQTLAQNAAAIGLRETELKMIQTELNMIRASEHLDRENRGYGTALSLFGVVKSLSAFPGRKTIVFFSEGLPASPALSARLDSIIDAANRANVTAYAVDANGLRAKSTATTMQKEMEAFTEERFRQLATGTDRTEQPLMMEFERVEDTLRLDSRTGLARLAGDTGGFLIEQSNDLTSAFRRIDEDNQFHYLLTYSPVNTVFDGKYRTIHVKVRRPGMQVFARRGYRAIRRPAALDAGRFELPALALLDRTPLPNAFPVQAAAFSFPEPARPGLTPVVVQVATKNLQFDVDSGRSAYSANAAIVVRIRDGRGREVQKVSQQYVLAGDDKNLEAAKGGEILFYREVDLDPGIYTMEAIVFDAVAAQGSARIATLSVPTVDPSARGMSSLVLVRRVEELGDAPRAATDVPPPFYVGQRLLYPNLGEPIQKSDTAELPFYFVLYGAMRASSIRVQLLRDGRTFADAPIDVPPDTGSRIPHVGRIPIGALPPGTYELRMRVIDGAKELVRGAYFTVRE
jgi:VWFA-related protein